MKEMTPRQRVATAFAHGQPDRMPLDLMGTAGCLEDNAYLALCEHLGVKQPGRAFRRAWNVRFYNEHVLEKLHVDFRRVWMREPVNWQPVAVDEQTEMTSGECWSSGSAMPRGLSTSRWQGRRSDDLDRYAWPDPADPGRIAGLADEAQFSLREYSLRDFRAAGDAGDFRVGAAAAGPRKLHDGPGRRRGSLSRRWSTRSTRSAWNSSADLPERGGAIRPDGRIC